MITLAALGNAIPVRAADISYQPADSRGPAECSFKGEIVFLDIAVIESALAKGCPTIFLDSSGGDVDAALEIGKRIRARKVTTIVPRKGSCASACVFLYAAGVSRAPYGPVYIHRPYTTATGGTYAQTQATYADLDKRVRAYLKAMNVNPALYDEMLRIPPEQSRALTINEMKGLGMGFVDPVYDEYQANKMAESYGLTKEQYLTLRREATARCGSFDEPVSSALVESRLACWRRYFPRFGLD